MNKIKVVIIDDEPDSISLLELRLTRSFQNLEIIGSFTNPKIALENIEILNPDLLFLDIEMPQMNGFDFLENLLPLHFSVIFLSAYNQYAIKAFRFNALDYLVKPIIKEDLMQAVSKAEKSFKPTKNQLLSVSKQLNGEPITKIAIPSITGVSFIELNDIIYAEATNNYTKIFTLDGKNITISRTLKDVHDVLDGANFFRIHRQYLINLNCVKQFNRNDSIITMNNGAELPISRNQKDKFSEKYKWL